MKKRDLINRLADDSSAGRLGIVAATTRIEESKLRFIASERDWLYRKLTPDQIATLEQYYTKPAQ